MAAPAARNEGGALLLKRTMSASRRKCNQRMRDRMAVRSTWHARFEVAASLLQLSGLNALSVMRELDRIIEVQDKRSGCRFESYRVSNGDVSSCAGFRTWRDV